MSGFTLRAGAWLLAKRYQAPTSIPAMPSQRFGWNLFVMLISEHGYLVARYAWARR